MHSKCNPQWSFHVGGEADCPDLPCLGSPKTPVIKTLAYVLVCVLFEYSHWSNRKDEQNMKKKNYKSRIISKRTSKVLY